MLEEFLNRTCAWARAEARRKAVGPQLEFDFEPLSRVKNLYVTPSPTEPGCALVVISFNDLLYPHNLKVGKPPGLYGRDEIGQWLVEKVDQLYAKVLQTLLMT